MIMATAAASILPSEAAAEIAKPTLEYDVLIIGAGTAGIPCAITAAEQGAKRICVIEKAEYIGGTLHLSSAHLSAGGTKRQKERGIDDSPDKHYDDVMRICRNTADPALVRLAVDEAPKTMEWLDALGMPWDDATPKFVYGHVPYKTARTVFANQARGGAVILSLMQPLWDKHVKAGTISVFTGHTLLEFTMDKNRVSGIIAEITVTKKKKQFRAKNVVIASGGYASNQEFYKKVMPAGTPPLLSTAAETSMGEGIIAAQKINAQFRNAEKHICSLGGVELEPHSGRVDYWGAWAGVFTSKYRKTREVYVNADGKRFLSEDEPNPDNRERLLMKQPDWKFWILFDDAELERSYAEGTPLVKQWIDTGMVREFAKQEKFLWAASSWPELARKAGFNAATIEQTMMAFNDTARGAGTDEMGRIEPREPLVKPPYYALLIKASSLISFGGIAVNGELQVLDTAGKPIAGLYAAGEVIGAAATSGNAFCGGMLITPALSFGRMLGAKLAKMGNS
jgi:fumarate reductase flavoprotein subunit